MVTVLTKNTQKKQIQ